MLDLHTDSVYCKHMMLDVTTQPVPSKWDERFMDLARLIASWSKDRSTKVGCVIVGPDREIRATGYNGFPRNVNDNDDSRHERPAKYLWTEHAERNAIFNAAKIGVPLAGCIAYLPWFPCADCARALVQSGISEIVAYRPDFAHPKYGTDFLHAVTLLDESRVRVRYMD